ncbi:MAG: DUF4492 domain-containing protein [Paludibacter sp.]|nr:DUF4492 domain-containing protein [Paludibacter sp.]
MKAQNIFNRIIIFYKDGFRQMTIGWTLWAIVLIKLFIMFAILKVFFFPNFLNSKGKTEQEKAAYVREQMIENEVKNDNR